ncbi:MAG TPA: hypothetical protein VKY74_15320 [Chloroflexia bacterium]|nr:hypothetical protein [Chloroflexia bacterium]
MNDPALTRKEATWLACKPKTCCYTAFVVPTGRDIWRIARTLDVPPVTFLVYFQAPAPRRDAFQLAPAGPYFRIALAKQATRRKKSPPPCIFLLRTRSGYHRCGLGADRPQVCHTFPADMVNGILYIQPESGCTCRRWTLADVEIAEETAAVRERQRDSEEYCGVVARWNATLATDPAPRAFTDYCDYVLAAYDALAPAATGAPDGRE